jgi:hypothetical protein
MAYTWEGPDLEVGELGLRVSALAWVINSLPLPHVETAQSTFPSLISRKTSLVKGITNSFDFGKLEKEKSSPSRILIHFSLESGVVSCNIFIHRTYLFSF